MATRNFETDYAEDFEEGAKPEQPPPNNRRGARQVALQVLYWDISSPGTAPTALRELTQRFALSEEVSSFVADLVHHVGAHDLELGDLIAAANQDEEEGGALDKLVNEMNALDTKEEVIVAFPDGGYWASPEVDTTSIEIQKYFGKLERDLKSK